MTLHLTKKLSSTKLLSSALVVAALVTTGSSSPVRADVVTPAQWLQRQPKPTFKPGHTLPRLMRYGWSLPLDTNVELTENWHYALHLPIYLDTSAVPGGAAASCYRSRSKSAASM